MARAATTLPTPRIDLSELFRDAWRLARAGAVASACSVRLCLGNGLRMAWARARYALARRAAAAALRERIAINDKLMHDVQAEIDAGWGIFARSPEELYEHMDRLHQHGIQMRDELAEIEAPAMVPQQAQQQQANGGGEPSLRERKAALREAGIRVICRGHFTWMADYLEDHPWHRRGGVSTAVYLDREPEAVAAGEKLLADYLASLPAAEVQAPRTGYEFQAKIHATARDCYFAMMAVEETNLVSPGSAFTHATGLLATDLATSQKLTIDQMSDCFCAEEAEARSEIAPVPEPEPDLSTNNGLATVLVGRTANLALQGGEALYRVAFVSRWTSDDGALVRDYVRLETSGFLADDRKGPIKLHIVRRGPAHGPQVQTRAGVAAWGHGRFCDSGTKRSNADDVVRELLAVIAL